MAIDTITGLKDKMPVNVVGGTTVSDIHDLIDTMEFRTTQTVSVKTASYTATASDNRTRFIFDSATAVTLTLPATLAVGWECFVATVNTGAVTIAVTGGALRSRENHTKTAGQYASAYLFVYANAGTAPQVLMTGDTAV